jgi:hypothetical protein
MATTVAVVEVLVGHKSFLASVAPDAWWEHQYSTPFDPTSPAWAAFFDAIRKGRKGPLSVLHFLFDSAADAAVDSPEAFDRDNWQSVAYYTAANLR